MYVITNGQDLTIMHSQIDIILLACAYLKLTNVSINEFSINPSNKVSLPGFESQGRLNYDNIKF